GVSVFCVVFFFNDTATTEIYTLSLHDALPISLYKHGGTGGAGGWVDVCEGRSEEHTSELQSPMYLVCRLLLEKKKKTNKNILKQQKKKKKKQTHKKQYNK